MEKKEEHKFCRFQLKQLRKDLKILKIKIPKIDRLGGYITINKEIYEVHNGDCGWSKRHSAIYKYLEKQEPKLLKELEKIQIAEIKTLKKKKEKITIRTKGSKGYDGISYKPSKV